MDKRDCGFGVSVFYSRPVYGCIVHHFDWLNDAIASAEVECVKHEVSAEVHMIYTKIDKYGNPIPLVIDSESK